MSISDLVNVVLVIHTLLLYPIFKFVFLVEKRITILETKVKTAGVLSQDSV